MVEDERAAGRLGFCNAESDGVEKENQKAAFLCHKVVISRKLVKIILQGLL